MDATAHLMRAAGDLTCLLSRTIAKAKLAERWKNTLFNNRCIESNGIGREAHFYPFIIMLLDKIRQRNAERINLLNALLSTRRKHSVMYCGFE